VADSRRWPRIPLALTVRMRFSDFDEVVQGRTANVSREGLFIRMDKPRPIGTTVHVELEVVNTGDRVVVDGVVVRSVPDPDERATGEIGTSPPRDEIPGIAVFLTGASDGWEHLCDALARHKSEKSAEVRLAAKEPELPAVEFHSPSREPK
jgi:hypothetical protein